MKRVKRDYMNHICTYVLSPPPRSQWSQTCFEEGHQLWTSSSHRHMQISCHRVQQHTYHRPCQLSSSRTPLHQPGYHLHIWEWPTSKNKHFKYSSIEIQESQNRTNGEDSYTVVAKVAIGPWHCNFEVIGQQRDVLAFRPDSTPGHWEALNRNCLLRYDIWWHHRGWWR